MDQRELEIWYQFCKLSRGIQQSTSLKGDALDFYKIRTKEAKGFDQAYPDWIVDNSQDLMVRGGSFYAVWDEESGGMWSTNEYDVQRLVDADLYSFAKELGSEGRVKSTLSLTKGTSVRVAGRSSIVIFVHSQTEPITIP